MLTSPKTDEETRAFFARTTASGSRTASSRSSRREPCRASTRRPRAPRRAGLLLENPDGHGGVFAALVESGELDRLSEQGVEQLVYVQVDNVLAPVDDPELVGLALVERTDVVTKVLEKTHPDERVGHLVTDGTRDRVVEYTEPRPSRRARAPTPAS